jgi:hypothetical protein
MSRSLAAIPAYHRLIDVTGIEATVEPHALILNKKYQPPIPTGRSPASIPNRDRHIDVTGIEPAHPANQHIINQKLLATYIPLDLAPTNNQTAFAEQLAKGIQQRAFDEFFSGRMFNMATLQQISNTVEKATRTDISFGQNQKGDPEHIFKVDLKAFEQKALIRYEGIFTSSFTYRADKNDMEFRISKALSADTVVELTSTGPMGQIGNDSRLTVTYSF